MKKRTVSILLAAAVATGSLTGCGGSSAGKTENANAEEGKVINIYSWNRQTRLRMTKLTSFYRKRIMSINIQMLRLM